MSSRERFALGSALVVNLVLGIVALWWMQLGALGTPLPDVDLDNAVDVAERTSRSPGSVFDAHGIFEKNPAGRYAADVASTPRDDYFLKGAHRPQLDRLQVMPSRGGCLGENGERRTYIIDGDLWVHSFNALTVEFLGNELDMTFLVRGDVHIHDDIVVPEDGRVRIIAVPDSAGQGGHIILNDPHFGTLARVDAELFASR